MSHSARVLVTGASGFVGTYVVARLKAVSCDVVTMRGRDVTAEGVAAVRPDVVVHLAAMTQPDACQTEPEQAKEANVEITRRLARGASATCRRFVYASTDLVFDGEGAPYAEDDEARPVCVYGGTKLEGERAARDVLGDRATTVRLALLYGPRVDPGARRGFAEAMIERARAGEVVRLYEDQFRTPLYVEDAAESLVRLAALPPAASFPLVHLGGPQRCSRYEMGRIALDVFELPLDLARANRMADHPAPAPRPSDVSLDSARARAMGLPGCGLREGFRRFRDRMKRP